MAEKYRTIVADPPWHYDGFARSRGGRWADGTSVRDEIKLPYGSMTNEEIAALPVAGMADRDSRLFLWTTNRYLRGAFDVMAAWGFHYKQTLVWHKTGNPTPFCGSVAPIHAEFLLVGACGNPERQAQLKSSVLSIDTNPAILAHSQKPDVFLDLIEQISPPPRLELFARRARFGWDYWGDESLGTAQLPEPALATEGRE